MLLSLSIKLFVREVRSGYLTSMLVSLVLAITIVSGISLFTDRLEQALNTETEEFLGGKVKFESNQNTIKPLLEKLEFENTDYMVVLFPLFSENEKCLRQCYSGSLLRLILVSDFVLILQLCFFSSDLYMQLHIFFLSHHT